MGLVIEYKKDYMSFVLEKIEEYITLCVINCRSRNPQNEIIVLLPLFYKSLLEKYLQERNYIFNFSSFEEIKIQGIDLKFFSPDKNIYIFHKDFYLVQNHENWCHFKIELK